MKSFVFSLVAVLAFASSAFAGNCCHNNQVQAIVQPVYVQPVRQVQFVEVPHANVQLQVQHHQKALVVAQVNNHHNNQQNLRVEKQVRVERRGLLGRREVRVEKSVQR